WLVSPGKTMSTRRVVGPLQAGFPVIVVSVIGAAIRLRQGMDMAQRRRHGSTDAKAALRDTPPVDAIYRGRSPGLRVVASVRLPGERLSDMNVLSLAAYSCGGSFGFGPCPSPRFPLSSGLSPAEPR